MACSQPRPTAVNDIKGRNCDLHHPAQKFTHYRRPVAFLDLPLRGGWHAIHLPCSQNHSSRLQSDGGRSHFLHASLRVRAQRRVYEARRNLVATFENVLSAGQPRQLVLAERVDLHIERPQLGAPVPFVPRDAVRGRVEDHQVDVGHLPLAHTVQTGDEPAVT